MSNKIDIKQAKKELLLRKADCIRISNSCHEKQLAFVNDKNDRIAVLAGRRSGKSHGQAIRLLRTCRMNPGETVVAIALSRGKAWQIFGSALERIGELYDIKLQRKTIEGQLSIVTPWKSRIWIAGCDNKSEVEKFRGDRLAAAAIDEADSMRSYLGNLVEDAVGPALEDLGGWMCLSGTPGAIPEGYFYDATTGKLIDWSLHHFDVRNNTYMPNPFSILEKAQRRLPDATFKREWLGEWVRDDEALIFSFDAARNSCRNEQVQAQQTIIGIDLGYVDACAWVVLKYTPGDKYRYIVECKQEVGLTPSKSAAITEQLIRKYPGAILVADVGGLGKGYVTEWAYRYSIQVEAAQKQKKAGYIAMMSSDLLEGSLRVDPYSCASLLNEWEVLQWNEDRTNHDERCQNHLSDAALYAWRRASGKYQEEIEDTRTEDEKIKDKYIKDNTYSNRNKRHAKNY
jgi:hypothetical protein